MGSDIKHVAIIMDGNGRWARERSHPRVWGHIRGSSVVSDIVEEASTLGLSALTLYAFSTENWSRPLEEINTLFNLLKKFLEQNRIKIIENQIRFNVIGDRIKLPSETKELIEFIERETFSNKGLKLTFAFDYGGRTEILNTFKAIALKKPMADITVDDVTNNLYASDLGDVDLLIRTGGEQRISNFLLWQIAYAEIYFTKTKWPDFCRKEFKDIIQKVFLRERRFGFIKNFSFDNSIKLAQKHKSFMGSG